MSFLNARALDIHILENRPHITVKDSYEIAIQEALKKKTNCCDRFSVFY